MLIIDGSRGEGGGQILRTSLALALVTGKPFRIERIRHNRDKPGLLRQHLTAVLAAVEVGAAEVAGAHLGSRELTFTPDTGGALVLRGGEYEFAIGTAGSTTLVFQTVLPALALAAGASTVRLEGGTHNDHAPAYDFLARAFLPLVARMGVTVSSELARHGFYPAGGGAINFRVEPAPKLQPLTLDNRGTVIRREARAAVADLARSIAARELAIIKASLDLDDAETRIERVTDSVSPGNYVCVEIESEQVTELFTAIGARGVTAEAVAETAATEARAYLAAEDAAVGTHLADQLLVPLALAGRGSFTTTAPLSSHTTTNIETIKRFLDLRITAESVSDGVCRIEVGG